MHEPASHSHRVHAAVPLTPSLVRLSAVQRLAIAVALAAVLWGAVAWALTSVAS